LCFWLCWWQYQCQTDNYDALSTAFVDYDYLTIHIFHIQVSCLISLSNFFYSLIFSLVLYSRLNWLLSVFECILNCSYHIISTINLDYFTGYTISLYQILIKECLLQTKQMHLTCWTPGQDQLHNHHQSAVWNENDKIKSSNNYLKSIRNQF